MKTMMKTSVVLIVLFGLCIPLHGQVAARQRVATSTVSSPLVTALVSREQVRFTALALAQKIRLEILSQNGELLYDTDFRPGNVLARQIKDQQVSDLRDGFYGCLVTVVDLYGQISHRRGIFQLKDGKVSFQAPQPDGMKTAAASEDQEDLTILRADNPLSITLVTHDENGGLIESSRGNLDFQAGTFSPTKDNQVPHMRLTPDGNLGIGVREPAARVDVAGLIRTEGIIFPDGTIQRAAAGNGFVAMPGDMPENAQSKPGAAGILAQGGRTGMSGATAEGNTNRMGPHLSSTGPGRVNGTEDVLNTFYGSYAGQHNTGICNTFVGSSSGWVNKQGSKNSFFGFSSGQGSTVGDYSSYFGYDVVGYYKDTEHISGGSGNAFFGAESGYFLENGSYNSFLGAGSGREITDGNFNTFVGYESGTKNTTANFNSYFGYHSGESNTTGANNAFFGTASGLSNTTSGNSFFGDSSGYYNTSGAANAFFGTI